MTNWRVAPWALAIALVCASPVRAGPSLSPVPQLKGLTANEAQLVVAELMEGQRAVKARGQGLLRVAVRCSRNLRCDPSPTSPGIPRNAL